MPVLAGTTQTALLVGYDDKEKLIELSPAAVDVGGHGERHFRAIAGQPVYKLLLSSDPTVLSAKQLCPGGKTDRDLIGTTPCTVDQLLVAVMTHAAGGDPIAAKVVIDPYGEVVEVAEAE